ncbi:DNA-binding transcriptional regulator BolA-like isoform X2 [Physella acuta]|nr:DNA-binding transcriptional regulator BolA-like isoform X2 [Physella acuta]XP_059156846.1 DNA-binding transcriptional regulator BolA-like isoform X2 [Physella acuta]XP_059156847.1 DNA-binding transcriptional regulator BolA-like isoform X2 [Physella acuta]
MAGYFSRVVNKLYLVKQFSKVSFTQRHLVTRTVMGDEKPIESAIRKKLSEALNPQYLDVINESYMHNVPKGTESHFKVVIVSSAFENVKRIEKHKLVHKAIQEEIDNSIHALSIVAKTPQEWETSQDIGQSPACRGGAGL